jgi:hypothetical protein
VGFAWAGTGLNRRAGSVCQAPRCASDEAGANAQRTPLEGLSPTAAPSAMSATNPNRIETQRGYELVATLDDHAGAAVTGLRFAAGGRSLISCAADGSIVFRRARPWGVRLGGQGARAVARRWDFGTRLAGGAARARNGVRMQGLLLARLHPLLPPATRTRRPPRPAPQAAQRRRRRRRPRQRGRLRVRLRLRGRQPAVGLPAVRPGTGPPRVPGGRGRAGRVAAALGRGHGPAGGRGGAGARRGWVASARLRACLFPPANACRRSREGTGAPAWFTASSPNLISSIHL